MTKSLLIISLFLSSLFASAQITNGLIASYNFNASNAVDNVVPRLNGVTTAAYSNDRFSNPASSFIFNGANSIDCAHSSKLLVSTGLTISAWIKLNTVSGQQAIVSKWAAAQATDQFLFMMNGNKTTIAVGQPSASASGYSGSVSLTTGVWYHVVATWDNTGLHQTYVNGVLDVNVTSTTFTTINNTSTTSMYIGSQLGNARFFNGNIDDVQIFNRKLSSTEINTLYSAPNPIVNNLVAKYSFDNANIKDDVGTIDGASTSAAFTTDRFGNTNSAFDVVANTSKVHFYDSFDGFIANATGKFSQAFWVNFNQITNAYQMIISKSADAGCTQNQREYLLRLNASNKLEITSYSSLAAGSYMILSGTSTLTANQWYHVVLTYDASVSTGGGADKYRLYLDGISETLSNTSSIGSGMGTGILDGSACIGIGHQIMPNGSSCSTTQSMNGKFDDYHVYNTVISQSTIDSLHNVTNSTTGLLDSKSNPTGINMFPNPVSNSLNFSKIVDEISVFDISGNLLITEFNLNTIDMTFLSNGIYIVVLKDKKGLKSYKKIIKN